MARHFFSLSALAAAGFAAVSMDDFLHAVTGARSPKYFKNHLAFRHALLYFVSVCL
jgi:hypothetical protein